jgi:hypothetical protein
MDAGAAKMKNKLQTRKRNAVNNNLTYDQADLDSGLDEGGGNRFKVGNNNSRGEYT